MKQPHTEETVRHTEDQQNTGTHKKPSSLLKKCEIGRYSALLEE
jgi:hypothetical protein